MKIKAPSIPIGKIHRLLIDPHLGWIPVFALSLAFGLGTMYFDDGSILTVLFACLFGLGLERTTYPLPKTFRPTTRLLSAVKKGIWFGVLFALMFHLNADGGLNGTDLGTKAVIYGGFFVVINAILPTPEPPKYAGIYKAEAILDQGGGYAALVLAWPFVTAIGGLILLVSVPSPIWGGAFCRDHDVPDAKKPGSGAKGAAKWVCILHSRYSAGVNIVFGLGCLWGCIGGFGVARWGKMIPYL